MKLVFLTVGRFKSPELAALTAHYLKLAGRFATINEVELALPRGMKDDAAAQDEALLAWLGKRSPRFHLTILDERGKSFTSREFSRKLEKIRDGSHTEWIIAIAGAHGFGEKLRARADLLWSLSPMTMAHELAAAVAAEQVFRAFTILNNHPYHND